MAGSWITVVWLQSSSYLCSQPLVVPSWMMNTSFKTLLEAEIWHLLLPFNHSVSMSHEAIRIGKRKTCQTNPCLLLLPPPQFWVPKNSWLDDYFPYNFSAIETQLTPLQFSGSFPLLSEVWALHFPSLRVWHSPIFCKFNTIITDDLWGSHQPALEENQGWSSSQ